MNRKGRIFLIGCAIILAFAIGYAAGYGAGWVARGILGVGL